MANFGGGNTSVKTREVDHAGREIDVLWVKGSGSDLATMDASGFTGLRLEEILPLFERDAMSDEEMVAYLARCQLEPSMPRCSIETLLHAFVPAPHVDHTHPDAINAIAGAVDGEALARECFGDEVAWIDYIRPGFTLARQVGEAIRADAAVRVVILAKHGLVTLGRQRPGELPRDDRRDQPRRRLRQRAHERQRALRRRRATAALLDDAAPRGAARASCCRRCAGR